MGDEGEEVLKDLEMEEPAWLKRDRPETEEGGRAQKSGRGSGGTKGGYTRGGGASSSVLESRIEKLEDMVTAVTDLTLETKADVREIQGFVQTAVLLPADLLPVVKGLEEGTKCAQEVRGNRGKNIGPAHGRIAIKFIKALSEMEQVKADKELVAAMQAFWVGIIQQVSPEELVDHIQIFRLTKPKQVSDDTKNKVGYVYAKLLCRFRPPTTKSRLASNFEEELTRCSRSGKCSTVLLQKRRRRRRWHRCIGIAKASE